MKRMHVGMKVDDVESSIEFYAKLFGRPPTLQRSDYAKWMLDDPCVNFSVYDHGDGEACVDHLGIQVETETALEQVRGEWDEAGLTRQDQDDLVCGYQRQDKSWVFDPHSMPWEVFVTHGVVDGYGTNEMPTDPSH